MKKNSGSMRYNSGAHTSPGTPEYGVFFNAGELPKSWNSERIPVAGNSRIQISPSALIPFNSGRTLPSKWDDAERWITSPISGDYSGKSYVSQPQGKPKSKSGPLGPPGHVYLTQTSPIPKLEGDNSRNLTENAAGIDGSSIHHAASMSVNSETDNSVPSSQEDKLKGEEEVVGANCRDVGTQMSPTSSPRERLSFSALSLLSPVSMFPRKARASSKDVIRDVQVDKDATTVKGVNGLASPWTASRSTSKLRREEAKITAWENLQKARAEAAIRKLEMDLEKKRSASMDRISNKLRAAKKKAAEMRISLSSEQQQPPGQSCCLFVKSRRRFLLCRSSE